MTWFYNLKIASKLLLSFALILMLTLVLGVASITQLGQVNATTNEINTNWLPSVRMLLTLKNNLALLRNIELQHVMSNDVADMDKSAQFIGEIRGDVQKNVSEYAPLVSEGERVVYDQLKEKIPQYLEMDKKIVEISRAFRKDDAIKEIRGDSLAAIVELDKQVEHLVKINSEGSAASAKEGEAIYNKARLWMIGLMVAMLLLGFALALWIARVVAQPLGFAVDVARSRRR